MEREARHEAGEETRWLISHDRCAVRAPCSRSRGSPCSRSPRPRPTFEGFGEDPYLAGEISVPNIEGIQSEGIIAEVKHYAANNQEPNRFAVNEVIDDRTLTANLDDHVRCVLATMLRFGLFERPLGPRRSTPRVAALWFYPLYLFDASTPEQRDLLERSLAHWAASPARSRDTRSRAPR